MKYLNLQVLRALAAFSVVLHLATDTLQICIANIDAVIYFVPGGVDIFFAIICFVICKSVDSRPQSPRAFFAARLARIVPIYWLLTGVASLGSIVTGINQTEYGLAQTVAAGVVGSVIVSMLFHLNVERPLNKTARSLLSARRSDPMAVPSGV